MKLERLTIKNFLGIGWADLEFNRPGITLIEGMNHDSPTSISNGSGKSSLFEALYWALYGKTKRGLNGEDVINNRAKKNCVVELLFKIGDRQYWVGRRRKCETYGTGLWLSTWDAKGKPTDLTKGTVKDTQALLEEIIKLDDLTFSKIAYFGQGDVKAFAELSDAELKAVFEQGLGLTFFKDYLEKAKSHLGDLREKAAGRKGKFQELERQRAFVQEKIDYYTKAIKELKERLASEKERLRRELEAASIEIEALQRRKANGTADLAEREKKIAAAQLELKGLQDLKEKLQAAHAEVARDLTASRVSEARARAQFDELVARQKRLAEVKEGICDECGNEYSDQGRERLVAGVSPKVDAASSVLSKAAESVDGLVEKANRMGDLGLSLDAKIERLKDVRIEAGKLEVERRNLLDLDRQIMAQVKRRDGASAMLKGLASDGREYDGKIRAEYANDAALEKEQDGLKAEVEALTGEAELAEMLTQALGNGGLKSYIFDSVTPELNRLIDGYIKVLDDIDIEIATVKKLKGKEEYRERFDIKVNNLHGGEGFKANSGGEQAKINLAVALGFNRLVRSMSEGSVNALFLDEPFEALDEGSAEKVVELCQVFADMDNVFLITHQQAVKELIASTIRVEKRDGQAVIA